MNGFRKSKGIVIELTALLDVILIMLFWVMMNTKSSGEDIKEQAESRIAAAESKLETERESWEQEKEQILADASSQIDEAWKKAESIDSQAAENQQALDGYAEGLLVTLNLRYDENSGALYISDSGSEHGTIAVTDENTMAEKIIFQFENMGLEHDSVVLCAMVYDGDTALYRDVRAVTSAVDIVGETYENFYCTFINTTK